MKQLNNPQQFNILLVSSSGGVLLDLLALKPWWSLHTTTWAVVKAHDTETVLAGNKVLWVHERPRSRPWSLLFGIIEAFKILKKVKPDFIISAGSGVAVGYFIAAKFQQIPSFWIETFNMVSKGGFASWICTKIANEIIVQRESLLKIYPQAVMIGELY
jgi:hypothetical protein